MNGKNIRADPKFNTELVDIKKQRVRKKVDKKETSNEKLTSLIPKHNSWKKLKEDIINDKTVRVDPTFNDEIEDIKKKRLEKKLDHKRISTRIITALIRKHNSWKMIKEDLVKVKIDKRGVATFGLPEFIVVSFVVVVLFASMLYASSTLTNALLDSNIVEAGSVNFTAAVEDTVGRVNTGMQNGGGLVALFILFGMVIAMILNGYLTREQYPAVFMVVDILIVLFAYILAVYVANGFEVVLGQIPFLEVFTSNLNLATQFVLLLPKITVIVGALVIIFSYTAIPKSKEEEVAGF